MALSPLTDSGENDKITTENNPIEQKDKNTTMISNTSVMTPDMDNLREEKKKRN